VTARPPKWQWPQVTDKRFWPTDVISERPDGQYRVLARDGAPGWNLLVRSDKLDSGWSLVAENQPTPRKAQDRARIHEHASKAAAGAPPAGRGNPAQAGRPARREQAVLSQPELAPRGRVSWSSAAPVPAGD
jgi:hypothetical protein